MKAYILVAEKLKNFEITVRNIETGMIDYKLGLAPTLRKAVELANKEQEEEPAEYGIVVRLRDKNWRG